MNKPFTLEEYKKNPTRLRTSYGDTVANSALVFDDSYLAVMFNDGSNGLYLVERNMTFLLRTEYEVRRARPLRGGPLVRSENYGGFTEWAGPEFEYKVEKY